MASSCVREPYILYTNIIRIHIYIFIYLYCCTTCSCSFTGTWKYVIYTPILSCSIYGVLIDSTHRREKTIREQTLTRSHTYVYTYVYVCVRVVIDRYDSTSCCIYHIYHIYIILTAVYVFIFFRSSPFYRRFQKNGRHGESIPGVSMAMLRLWVGQFIRDESLLQVGDRTKVKANAKKKVAT